ncbi:ATP-binding protein [Halobacterium wangiae]|uniref:ATP-binding protein n=1 Tax=Halobacterium wangiae TaxID=2902623 RepID=UPI003D7BDFE5
MVQRGDELEVTEGDVTLPATDVLTGRGFVTGKSGSGKSNTASVLVEELLDHEARLLIVDTDGEYYGLKEQYEVLHLGASDRCDAVVGAGDAEKIADIALSDGVPVVLDVSGFLEGDVADRLVYEVTKHLFSRARDVRQPFLLLVEEVHEFVPEKGGLDDVGEMIVRVAKRGRKRGIGLCGMSQRPASVDKDFITQCDWLVWHRLTWANDTKVVDRILGGSYSTDVEMLDDGEAFLMADWEEGVQRVQFRRKRTFDAGATPGFGEADTPDLKPVDEAWLEHFGTTASDVEPLPTVDVADSPSTADADSETIESVEDDEADETEDYDETEIIEAHEVTEGGPNRDPGPAVPAQTAGPTQPVSADDPRSALLEFGQLVAHVGLVGVRRTASGLSVLAREGGRAADRGVRWLGRELREFGGRALDAVDGGDRQPAVPTVQSVEPESEWLRHSERPVADRLVGLAALVAASALAYLAIVVV